jgi:prepilin-type N-terminal cleavage/methylation domain-containing protein
MDKKRSHGGREKIEQGFTLLEVIVAISLLTFGLLAVASMQVAAMKGNAASWDLKEATHLAVTQMERLITLPYNDPLLEDTDGDGFPGLNAMTEDTADHFSLEEGKFTVFWNVAMDDVVNHSKTINVLVTWTDRGRQRHVVLQNLISDS